ncbi:MAG TPA: YceI family protein [Balneolaceae bacterium]|nr:YceI family protein [Balneolaceae bacterium]
MTTILITGALLGIPNPVAAQVYKTEHGEAQVFSKATLENFTGKSNYLVGQVNLADSTVSFYLDLSTLSTGVELRDEHMQEEFLETDKYPFAQFSGKLVSPFDPTSPDTQQVKVQGQFKIHGVSRDITVDGEMARKNNQLYVQAKWKLDLPDYNIAIPQVLFMKVSKTQQLSITATMDKKDKNS